MIYIEKQALKSFSHKLIEKNQVDYQIIESSKQLEDSKDNIVIVDKQNTFVHGCPATQIYRCCNYKVIDAIEGCIYDCSYCVLQAYLNEEKIKIYAHLEGIKEALQEEDKKGRFRIGTGELSDSLALDSIIPLSTYFNEIANKLENITFEYKTKSANIANLLNLNPKNVMVGFSVNSEFICENEEHKTASLSSRLKAAKTLTEYGYKVGFHFDPMVYHDNWKKEYEKVVLTISNSIPHHMINYISASTFRFPMKMLNTIRDKFDKSVLLSGDFIKGEDNKTRYFKILRMEMLGFIVDTIKQNMPGVPSYLCMEHNSLWEKIYGFDPGEKPEFEKQIFQQK